MTASTLIHHDGRVLAALDFSAYASSVADTAGWAAARMAAPLGLVHAIDRHPAEPAKTDLSGSLSLGSQEDLLAELATLDEARGKLAQQSGRRLLEQAQTRVADAFGVHAEIRQRHGGLVETLLELETGVRLFVLGKRGEHADSAKGHLGSNLERVMRAVHRPVLVASRAFQPVNKFLIAFDDSPTTRKCVEMVCASPLLKGLQCSLLMVADPTKVPAGLAWAQNRLTEAGFSVREAVISGPADAVIAAQVKADAIDLLVMGAYGHSKIRTLIVGSTTTQVLRASRVPVLLLR